MTLSITTENLGKRYNREWIFRRLGLTLAPGQTYAVTGPNGAGKSTLLQVLWGQMPPSTGAVNYRIGDTVVAVENVFRHIAIATPYMDLIEEFTLAEQLNFHFKLRKSRQGMRIHDMIDRMYLGSSRDKFISHFSSGMRQRLKLAMAFFTEADVIFLDEPGTNLDQQAFEWYVRERDALPASCTLVIASNQPAEYPANARKVDIMDYK